MYGSACLCPIFGISMVSTNSFGSYCALSICFGCFSLIFNYIHEHSVLRINVDDPLITIFFVYMEIKSQDLYLYGKANFFFHLNNFFFHWFQVGVFLLSSFFIYANENRNFLVWTWERGFLLAGIQGIRFKWFVKWAERIQVIQCIQSDRRNFKRFSFIFD